MIAKAHDKQSNHFASSSLSYGEPMMANKRTKRMPSTSLPICVLILVIVFAQVMPQTVKALKFIPSTRYGRRSDLPPLLAPPPIFAAKPQMMLPSDTLLKSDFVNFERETPMGSTPTEEYMPFWCTEFDRKSNLYKCFDRFPIKLAKQVDRPIAERDLSAINERRATSEQ